MATSYSQFTLLNSTQTTIKKPLTNLQFSLPLPSPTSFSFTYPSLHFHYFLTPTYPLSFPLLPSHNFPPLPHPSLLSTPPPFHYLPSSCFPLFYLHLMPSLSYYHPFICPPLISSHFLSHLLLPLPPLPFPILPLLSFSPLLLLIYSIPLPCLSSRISPTSLP